MPFTRSRHHDSQRSGRTMIYAAGVVLSAGSRALAAVMVGLMVFSSCAAPEPEQPGGRETASASNAPVTPEFSPHPFAGDSTWIAYQTDRGGEGVWLVHPDGTEDHQIAMDVAEQQLLPQLVTRWWTAGVHYPWRID
jgi:hypothetical protein